MARNSRLLAFHSDDRDPWSNPTPRCERHVITPEIAGRLLEKNTNNRKPSPRVVEALAIQIRRGEWMEDASTIRIDRNLVLADGQHRLMAIVATGIPIATYVHFGVNPNAFTVMDRGKKRGHSDDLYVAQEKNTTLLAATLRLIDLDAVGQLVLAGKGVPLSKPLFDILANHPDVRESVAYAHARSGFWKEVSFHYCVLAFCHYRFHQINRPVAEDFFEKLTYGTNLQAGSPVLTLRNRIMSATIGKENLLTNVTLAFMIKSWNHFRAGKNLRVVKWVNSGDTPESFPSL